MGNCNAKLSLDDKTILEIDSKKGVNLELSLLTLALNRPKYNSNSKKKIDSILQKHIPAVQSDIVINGLPSLERL